MKTWKKFVGTAAVSVLAISLAACGEKSSGSGSDDKTLVVGASNVPHAEILEHVKKEYEAKGYKLEIRSSKITYFRTKRSLQKKSMRTTSSTYRILSNKRKKTNRISSRTQVASTLNHSVSTRRNTSHSISYQTVQRS